MEKIDVEFVDVVVCRHAFVVKAPNNALHGAGAPRDGYVHSWSETVTIEDTPEDWDDLETWLKKEEETAAWELREWLARP